MSWNIHGTVGRTRRSDSQRTLDEIVRLAPDILILQEVDERTRFARPAGAFDFFRGTLTEQLVGLRAAPGDHAIDVRAQAGQGCACGNLLWSRFPIHSAEIAQLPGPDIETRRVIDAQVETEGGMLRVLGTHFALLPTTRLKQARAIRNRLDDADPRSARALVLGDLNEWASRGWVHNTLSAILPNVYAPKTWPERFPLASLDRLYASRSIEIVDAFTDEEAGKASDHRPIIADLRIRP